MQKRKIKIVECASCNKEREVRADNTATHCLSCASSKRHTTHGMSNTKLHHVWNTMRSRCIHEYDKNYYRYGGRGIIVCLEWIKDFKCFYNWSILNGYKQGLEIDRINNNGNYEPSNCRWTTREVQTRNTTNRQKNNTSGYRGVSWSNSMNKWRVQIVVNLKSINLGYYNHKIDSALVYDTFVVVNNLEHTLNFTPQEYT